MHKKRFSMKYFFEVLKFCHPKVTIKEHFKCERVTLKMRNLEELTKAIYKKA